MPARELIKRLEGGRMECAPHQWQSPYLRHASKPGVIVVAFHSGDIPKGTLRSILKQAGLEE